MGGMLHRRSGGVNRFFAAVPGSMLPAVRLTGRFTLQRLVDAMGIHIL
jgi:hypothetical protein